MERAEHYLRVVAIVCGLVLWITYAYVTATPGVLDRAGKLKGRDFPQFYTIGSLVMEGHGDQLQDQGVLTAWVRGHLPGAQRFNLVPVYGAQVALLMAPLALLPYGLALAVWCVVSIVLCGVSCWFLARDADWLPRHPATLWMVAAGSPGLFLAVYYGHLSSLALCCTVAGYVALRRERHVVAGLALGSLVYKPQLGLVFGIVFLLARDWRLVTGALIAAAFQAALATAVGGTGVLLTYLQRLASLARDPSVIQSKNRELNQSLKGFFDLLVTNHDFAAAAYIVCAVVVVVAAYAVWRSRSSLELRYAVLVMATVLAAPHFFVYDLLLLMTASLLLLDRGFLRPPSRARSALLADSVLLYLSPLVGLFLSLTAGIAGTTPLVAAVFASVALLSLSEHEDAMARGSSRV